MIFSSTTVLYTCNVPCACIACEYVSLLWYSYKISKWTYVDIYTRTHSHTPNCICRNASNIIKLCLIFKNNYKYAHLTSSHPIITYLPAMVRNSFCGKASEAVPPNLDCPRCGPLGTNNKSSAELQG